MVEKKDEEEVRTKTNSIGIISVFSVTLELMNLDTVHVGVR